jgi:D-alanyl-D-alanine carboxypeptidase (penicillin-binding protein 5/6)
VRHRVATVLLVILAGLCLGFGPPRLTESDAAVRSLTPQQIALMREDAVPPFTAAAALLVSPTTGQIIYAQNEHARRAPASLTKLVTALVAMERGDLDQPVTVTKEDLKIWTMIGLQEKETLSLYDMLYVLLIPSDNTAAVTIARTLGGTESVFVGWMNELVERWGLRNTHFANPHGLDAEENYTSAWDMAQIALYAESTPLLREILSTPETIAADRKLVSTNEMLRSYPGAVGVKTGTEELAGECLITLVERPQGDALSVVLGSTDRYADSKALLDHFYGHYAELHFDLPETPLNRYVDVEGNVHAFGLREPVTRLVRSWQMGSVTMIRRISNPATDPSADEPIGTLEIYIAGKPLAEVPLYAE